MVDKRSICTAVRKKSGSPAGSGSVSGKSRKSHRAQSRQKTGFPINIHAFQSHGTILRSARTWSRAKKISLASIPQRQARIRMRSETRSWKNVSYVFPSPFKMLPDEVAR